MPNTFGDIGNSPAAWIFFALAFALLFLAIWSGVLWITSRMSGWRALARHYPYSDEPVLKWVHRGGGGVFRDALPYGGMRGRLAVGATQSGIVIKPPFILRPFHPALLLPLDQIEAEAERQFLSMDFVQISMRNVPGVHVAILKSAREMVQKN